MKKKVAIISILVNTLLAGGKIIIGVFSKSVAVLADGVHSFVDVFSSGVGYAGIKIAEKPSDEKHPYGHYKFEVLGGAIINLIIFFTGIGIIYQSYQAFLDPKETDINILVLGVMVFSAVINEVTSRIKIHFGKKENSVSLLSDGVHDRVDVYTSLAILGGLFLTRYWIYADALLALLIGLYIIKESFSVGKEVIDSLLDVSAGQEKEREIKEIVKKRKIEINSLKTQKKGSAITANLEIKLSHNLTVAQATKISNELKEELIQSVKGLEYIAIQIKSHEIKTSFYQPEFGRGFGWQKKGQFKDKLEEAEGKGPEGYCVCPQCGYKKEHKKGIPCPQLKCPHCQISLKRE